MTMIKKVSTYKIRKNLIRYSVLLVETFYTDRGPLRPFVSAYPVKFWSYKSASKFIESLKNES